MLRRNCRIIERRIGFSFRTKLLRFHSGLVVAGIALPAPAAPH